MTINDFPDWSENNTGLYSLRMFIAGTSPVSSRAVSNLKEILEEHLKGRYSLEIIDVNQQPELVKTENITVLPVLIKLEPSPKRLLVGDMSDKRKVLRGLNL